MTAADDIAAANEYRPYTLIAELTYRCPLQCLYCSNPLDYARHGDALDGAAWLRVFAEAEALGVVQLHLTGGEPLLRDDLETLVEGARRLDLYVNLITSGFPLRKERLSSLRARGLDHVQLSIQDLDGAGARFVAGVSVLDHKLAVADQVKELGMPLTINCVLHRHNLERVPELIAFAERVGADRLELANTQFLGWALANRDVLMPLASQLEAARGVAAEARERLRGRMEILFVLPDYHARFPKACMSGWARRFLVVAPDGVAQPCHLARTLPGLEWPRVQDHPLDDIWNRSQAFNAYRGEAWMPEPCKSCEHRARDFGGCRCQAFALTGDAAATDPACERAPTHALVETARLGAMKRAAPRYRRLARLD
jgi:pyrroloquinoline quinone biosynthesis protein E